MQGWGMAAWGAWQVNTQLVGVGWSSQSLLLDS